MSDTRLMLVCPCARTLVQNYYKIGTLTPEDSKKAQNEFEFEDTYANDPIRDGRNLGCTLKVRVGLCVRCVFVCVGRVGCVRVYARGRRWPRAAWRARWFARACVLVSRALAHTALAWRSPCAPRARVQPWCGEPRTDLLIDNWYTPNKLFYTRNHLPVPDIKAEEWRVEVSGHGVKNTTFDLNDIKTKFKKYEVVSTLQCAGNRREDMHDMKGHSIFISVSTGTCARARATLTRASVSPPRARAQPHWVIGAISNAKWGGARLRDVLAYCGMPVDDMALGKLPFTKEQAHVQFEAYDEDETGACARRARARGAAAVGVRVVALFWLLRLPCMRALTPAARALARRRPQLRRVDPDRQGRRRARRLPPRVRDERRGAAP
jgi:hypothetical protein